MNREIKFRTWNPIARKLFYGHECYLHQSNDGLEAKITWNGEIVDQIIHQFTGLKDVNGKEIYEDDILIDNWGYVVEVKFGIFQVDAGDSLFDGNGFFVTYTKDKSNNSLTDGKIYKIVGNVFENPELLK